MTQGFDFLEIFLFPSYPFTETVKLLIPFFQISEFIVVFSFLNMKFILMEITKENLYFDCEKEDIHWLISAHI